MIYCLLLMMDCNKKHVHILRRPHPIIPIYHDDWSKGNTPCHIFSKIAFECHAIPFGTHARGSAKCELLINVAIGAKEKYTKWPVMRCAPNGGRCERKSGGWETSNNFNLIESVWGITCRVKFTSFFLPSLMRTNK